MHGCSGIRPQNQVAPFHEPEGMEPKGWTSQRGVFEARRCTIWEFPKVGGASLGSCYGGSYCFGYILGAPDFGNSHTCQNNYKYHAQVYLRYLIPGSSRDMIWDHDAGSY